VQPQTLPVQERRSTIAAYPDYPSAQAAVDRLADARFPVERTSIVAEGLRLVENVTGRLTWGRVLIGGAGTGLLFGLVVGWILALFAPIAALVAFLVYAALIGAIAGALAAGISYALSGGKRDFSSLTGVQAERYLLVVDDDEASEAARLLAEAGALAGARIVTPRRAAAGDDDEREPGGAAPA